MLEQRSNRTEVSVGLEQLRREALAKRVGEAHLVSLRPFAASLTAIRATFVAYGTTARQLCRKRDRSSFIQSQYSVIGDSARQPGRLPLSCWDMKQHPPAVEVGDLLAKQLVRAHDGLCVYADKQDWVSTS
jgi:hypothetical protein